MIEEDDGEEKAAKKGLDPTLPIYQLKISLQHIVPPIWRRLRMDDCSLDELHDIIQVSMGWEDARLRFLRCSLGYREGKPPAAAFSEGDLVRVKSGVRHDFYPDIPLGGWVGRVIRTAWLTPPGYEIRWTKSTLQVVHPVYLKRCRRDKIDRNLCWLDEGLLEAASAEQPVAMESPTNLVT